MRALILPLLVVLCLPACESCNPVGPPGAGDAGDDVALPIDEDGGPAAADGGAPGVDAGSVVDAGPVYVALDIEPQAPVLEATVGGSETLQLSAFLVRASGVRTPAPIAFWQSLDLTIGTVNETGLFTPTRERAGTVRVRARADGVEGTTVITVHLRETTTTGGASAPADFDGSIAVTGGPSVLYPLDGVVIPTNLASMLVQWNKVKSRGRVVLTGDLGSLELYTDGNTAQLPDVSWRRFLLAHVGRSFALTVEESEGAGTERVATTLTIHLADADLTSTVYYWAVDQGKIMRIDADSLEPTALPIPYEDVAEGGLPAEGGNDCVACHAVSANGQKMAYTYFGGSGPGGVVDVADVGNPIVRNRDARRWNQVALNPDGSLMLTALGRRISLRDGLTGDVIAGFEDISGVDSAAPAFAPTGVLAAFAGDTAWTNGEQNWSEIDFKRSNLYLVDVNPAGPALSNPRMIVPGNGAALYYPSFSPDGRLLAYTQGVHSRSVDPESLLPVDGDLWLAAATAVAGADGVPRVRLDRANPGHDSYLPSFNPKIEGGYMWIAFYTRRDYGHTLQGLRRPQIWVAAVDASADPATALADPSHPGFWLPGQATTTENLSTFFAPKPCANAGGTCTGDGSCCGDLLCRPVGTVNQCVPPETACALPDDTCTVDDDCCPGLLCSGGTCHEPGDICSQNGQVCALDADCCPGEGLCVDDGNGTSRCLQPEQRPCAELGDTCGDDQPCCGAPSIGCMDERCVYMGG